MGFNSGKDFGFGGSSSGGGGGGISFVSTCDTSTFCFYGNGTPLNPLCGCPQISACTGNTLVACSDGLYTNGGVTKICSIASGTSILDISPKYGYNAVFYNFTITDCTNYYAGVLTAVWNANTNQIEFTETSTSSIGNTAGVSFSFTITGNDVNLIVTVPSGLWKFSFTKTVLEDCCTNPYISGSFIITEDGNSPPNENIVTEDLPSQEIINNLGDFLVDNLGNLIATNSITSENLITE